MADLGNSGCVATWDRGGSDVRAAGRSWRGLPEVLFAGAPLSTLQPRTVPPLLADMLIWKLRHE